MTYPTDRLPNLRSRALAAAGVATLGLSLLMAIGPAVAKTDNGNSGTVKVHAVGEPADSGPDNANDPHVCQFWLGFYFAPNDSGTWEIDAWTSGAGAASAVAGTYDTIAGFASSDPMWLAPGHYKLFWLGTSDHKWKHKAFWVDDPCPDPSIVGSGDDPGTVDPGSDPGTVDPGTDPGTVDPGSDPGTVDPGTDPGTVDPGTDPGTVDPGSDPGTVDPGSDPGTVDPGSDPGTVDPGSDPGTVDPDNGNPQEGTQDGTSAGPAPHAPSPASVAAPAAKTGSRSGTLPDTSTGSNAMFVTAAGLLMLVVAHRLRRRDGALILG